MQDKNLIAPNKDELRANDVVKFFDNVTDASGTRLTKSVKRTRIKDLMESLYLDKENNQTTLNNGKTVPIIVKRRYEKRAPSYYFNTALAPAAIPTVPIPTTTLYPFLTSRILSLTAASSLIFFNSSKVILSS